jgi:hypothetical protein
MKSLIIKVFLVLSAILATLILGEVCLRIYLFANPKTYRIDQKLGWRARENYHWEGVLKDAGGRQCFAKITTDSHGFRLFGNPHSQKTKVLVLGDSFTYAKDVGDDQTFYSILAKRADNMEFFAYGAIGYGTLQEFMILDEFIDTIKPQIIILQFCKNDFFDNYEAMDSNRTMTRPYIDVNGKIYYKKRPPIISLLIGQSQLARYTFAIMGRFPDIDALKLEIENSGGNYDGFKKSSIIIKNILNKIRRRASDATVLAFSANETQPYYSELRKIALSEEVKFIDGVPEAVKAYEEKGFISRAADLDHWNEAGHKIVADQIYDYLVDHGYVHSGRPQGN